MEKDGEIFYNTLKKTYCFNGRTLCILWEVGMASLVWKLLKSMTKFPLHTPSSTLPRPAFHQTIFRRWDKVGAAKTGTQ